MNRFEYANPSSLAEAVALLGPTFDDAVALAGGTDLLGLMKDFVISPKRLVSLGDIDELKGIRPDGDGVSIGAMTTLDDLLASRSVRDRYPALIQAADGIRGPQMRAMGTVGGELLQRPRCWYFRRGHGLLAVKEGRSMVADGDHRYHAIFGNDGDAKFVHPSSLAPALIALGARCVVVGPSGQREVAVRDLFRTPAREGEREVRLAANELLAFIRIPAARPSSATYEVRHRRGLDWPEVAASAYVEVDGGRVERVEVVLGHVAPRPWPVDVRDALLGRELDDAAIEAAAQSAIRGASPLPQNGTKVELVKVAVARVLRLAAGRVS